MWTLKEKSVRRLDAQEVQQKGLPAGRLLQYEFSMTFTDGADDVSVSTFVSTKDEARQAVKSNLDRLNSQDELKAEIDANTFTFEPEPTPEPTQAELDQAEWVKDWGTLQKIQPLIDAGVLDGTEAPVVNLRTKVKTNFRPAYLELI